MYELLENIDWASFVGGVASLGLMVIAWWKAIPQKKKDNARAIISEALEDGNIDKNEAARVALALM